MRSLRKWHQYISLFFGPAIFFFALSGFLQLAGFHESHPGSTYQPAGWIIALSSLHQHQRLGGGEHHDMDHHDADAQEHKHHMDGERDGDFPLFKPFAVFTSWGLMLSSLLGMAIALTNPISRRTSLIVILAGIVVPVTLLLI
jgi:hypothetical protein